MRQMVMYRQHLGDHEARRRDHCSRMATSMADQAMEGKALSTSTWHQTPRDGCSLNSFTETPSGMDVALNELWSGNGALLLAERGPLGGGHVVGQKSLFLMSSRRVWKTRPQEWRRRPFSRTAESRRL